MASLVAIVLAEDVRAAEARDDRIGFRVPLSGDGTAPPTHYGGHLAIDDGTFATAVAGWPEVTASSYDPVTGEVDAEHFDLVLSSEGLQRVNSNAVPLTLKSIDVTGSIDAGSTTLTLASPQPSIAVGDTLIVEVGGEQVVGDNPELVSNGTFDADISGWTENGTGVTGEWDAGRLKVTTAPGGGDVRQEIATEIGRTYRLRFDVIGASDAAFRIADIFNVSPAGVGPQVVSAGTSHEFYFVANWTTMIVRFWCNSGSSSLIDNVSLKAADAGGTRGTRGVGGTWPALSYPDVATMEADTSSANGTYAWVEATGDTYSYAASTQTWNSLSWYYYYAKAIPRALVATVTAIDGTSVTLDTAAAVNTVDAPVHIDMKPVINAVTSGYGSRCNVEIPAGTFATSGRILMENKPGWTIRGQGSLLTTLFSPRGVSGAQIEIKSCPQAVVADLTISGNCREHGYGLAWDSGRATETGVSVGVMPSGVYFTGSSEAEVRDCAVIDTFQGIVASSCSGAWARRCDVSLTDTLYAYVQWHIQWADCFGGGAEDCTVSAPYLIAGIEGFKTLGTVFRRIECTNATAAMNVAGGFLFEDCTFVIEENSQHPVESFSQYNPVINLNANAGGGLPHFVVPGRVSGCSLTINGYINDTHNDTLIGLSAVSQYADLNVTNFSYSSPDFSPGCRRGPVGINSSAPGGVFTDVTISGQGQPGNWQGSNMVVMPSSTLVNVVVEDRVAMQGTVLPGDSPYNYTPA